MKDFLKDQWPWIAFFLIQCVMIIGIAQLAAVITGTPLNKGTIVYLFVLPLFCLLVFLLFRYYKLRDFYSLGRQQADTMPDTAPTRLLHIMKTYHDQQMAWHTEEIEALNQQKQLEFHFMQQWVHQMKTPVSVLHLIIQKEKAHLPEELTHSVQEEIERLQQGLDLALYQSRLQKFDRDFHVQQVPLKSVVKKTIQEFKSGFIRNQVYPAIQIDDSFVVATDQKWLRFVLNQIVSNSIKYSRDTSETIYFTASKNGKQVALEIRDTGYGILGQDLQRVFDPFFTGMNGRRFRESTGMGLYLSKEICNALGHGLTIDSATDKGTAVTITF